MKIVYSTTNKGRELRVEHAADPWQTRIVCDAPGERAVSHDLTPDDLDVLMAALGSLQPESSKPEIVLPATVHEEE